LSKPKLLKAGRDEALTLKRWFEAIGIEALLNKSKNGVAYVHKKINEKFRIINSSDDEEIKLSKIEINLNILNIQYLKLF